MVSIKIYGYIQIYIAFGWHLTEREIYKYNLSVFYFVFNLSLTSRPGTLDPLPFQIALHSLVARSRVAICSQPINVYHSFGDKTKRKSWYSRVRKYDNFLLFKNALWLAKVYSVSIFFKYDKNINFKTIYDTVDSFSEVLYKPFMT